MMGVLIVAQLVVLPEDVLAGGRIEAVDQARLARDAVLLGPAPVGPIERIGRLLFRRQEIGGQQGEQQPTDAENVGRHHAHARGKRVFL